MRILSKLLSNVRGRKAADGVASADGRFPATRATEPPRRNDAVAETLAHVEAGRLAQALEQVDQALQLDPSNGELLYARGATLFAWGRYREAGAALALAVDAGLRNGDVYAKLGWTYLWLGRTDEAAGAMQRAIDLAPGDWASHFGWATLLRAEKRTDEAKAAFERALALNPDDAHCLSSLIACEIDLGAYAAAELLARRGVALNPEKAGAHADLGMALCSQERHDEAVAVFERAENLEASDGDMGDDAVNYAICLLRAGRTRQALAMLERRLPHNPGVGLHSHYALALLISGRFAEAWPQYEFRWMDAPLSAARPNFVKPQWAGQDLRGKAILLWSEQGFGDFIQFIRYAVMLKSLGATVLVFLREELRELATGLPAIDRVFGANEPYPPFEYYVNLLSLPRVFGTDLASIPANVPYLRVHADRDVRWAQRIGADAKIKVGLVWAGSPTHLRDRFRSVTLESLAPLLQVPGARFYSLQKGPAAAALKASDSAADVVDLGPELSSFGDTAAAISHLDVVIGVDTAVAHLAGALGKRVWTLIPAPADWRWMEDSEDSPWYPTMRLFRQRTPGDWSEVIGRVSETLRDAVQAGALRTHPMETRDAGTVTAEAALSRFRAAAGGVAEVQGSDRRALRLSRVAQTRVGIVQYFPDDADVGTSIEYYGEYQQAQVEFLERFVAVAATVMEIDAGVGAHTLWLSRRVGHEGHVFAYEDDRLRRQVLEQNLRSNGVGNATVMRRRLRRPQPDRMAPDAEFELRRPHAQTPASADFDETIDELRLEKLDAVKINGSRGALDVLEGAAGTLWRLRPLLFVTVPADADVGALAARAGDFGYGCWRFEAPMFNPRNFDNRERDIFAGRPGALVIALPEERVVDVPLDRCRRLA
ncbi:MAG TPA: tetratricopeptide repeat protein [Casimicrobiaceae bacterium]|nr:tetratricopeptide repeat protein [Casimicrobiaceae bacterium]